MDFSGRNIGYPINWYNILRFLIVQKILRHLLNGSHKSAMRKIENV
jgi:hypothetical protein